jgi:hypothetical protein
MDAPIDDSIALPVLNLPVFKELLAKVMTISDRIVDLYTKTDLNSFTTDYQCLRSAFYVEEIFRDLSDVRAQITNHLCPAQKLVDEGDLRTTLNVPVYFAREIRDVLDNLVHLMTELGKVEGFQIQHYARCVNTRNEDLRQKIVDYSNHK